MPPQYLEQNDESSTGSVPLTPINHGPDLNANSTLKGLCVISLLFIRDIFLLDKLTGKKKYASTFFLKEFPVIVLICCHKLIYFSESLVTCLRLVSIQSAVNLLALR